MLYHANYLMKPSSFKFYGGIQHMRLCVFCFFIHCEPYIYKAQVVQRNIYEYTAYHHLL